MTRNTGATSKDGRHLCARAWAGATRAEDAAEYIEYLKNTGFAEYARTPGNRGVLALRRIVDGRAEFLLLSLWESKEAVRAFAGSEPERAVFYPEDDRYLVERDDRARHYEIAFLTGWELTSPFANDE
jgi:heme-degrading monooxygenase HmoA